MTNRASFLPWFTSLVLVVGGCTLDDALKHQCSVTADCDDGNLCVNSLCVTNTGSLPGSQLAPECTAPAGSSPAYIPTNLLSAAMVGTWLGCGATGLFGDADQAGIEFVSDGSWYLLRQAASGAPTRMTDSTHTGTYGVESSAGDAVNLTLHLASGMVQSYAFTIDDVPARMHLAQSGKLFTYASVALSRPSGCNAYGTGTLAKTPSDAPSFWALAAGRWGFCGGFSGTPGSQWGIELTDDNHFYVLRPNASGTALVRGSSPNDSGTMAEYFTGSGGQAYPDGPQVDLHVPGETHSVSMQFWSGTQEMLVKDMWSSPRFVKIP